MTLKDGVDLAQVEQLILLQVARLRPHSIQHRGSMTLERCGRDEIVYSTLVMEGPINANL